MKYCALILLIVISGCSTSSEKRSSYGYSSKTSPRFGFSVFDSFVIEQGATRPVDLLLTREPHFTQNVAVTVHADGIKVTPARLAIRAGANSVSRLQVVVPRDAAIGKYSVTVSGRPEYGDSVTTIFTVEVVAKK